ncbi:MAG TPA: DUF5691 domain-containing protein, partial [Roseiflexaceae bacterium]|nr:DUF5691 domain-containing protein [Roseiflexaceae bacterium]
MNIWNDILSAAIIGVERRPFQMPRGDGTLGALLARIDPADREGALLAAAGMVALYRQSGRLPASLTAPGVPVCPPDERRACGPRATQRLATLLDGNQRALLPEWLTALDAASRRVADAMLPDLLELGRRQSGLREAILPVLGRRGRWLAAQNPDWSYASAEVRGLRAESDPETLSPQASALRPEWETGSPAVRLALLREVRGAAPALARELVAATWASEKADDRAAFVEVYTIGLSVDDEPFLESALDDRSKEVRRAAAGLLARLPNSRLAARMLERVEPLLAWVAGEKPRLLGLRAGQPARIEVTLPAICDKAMIRDGVEPKPPADRKGLGEKAWWLFQMLSAVPPASWSRKWSVAPADLLVAAAAGEWNELLLDGWAAATLTFNDTAWAESLLRVQPRHAELLGALPVERQEALLLQILRADCTPLHQHPVLGLLQQTRHIWSAELTRAVLRVLH